MSDDNAPILAEVIEATVDGRLDDVRVALPGRIEDYDPDAWTATVQPLVMDGWVAATGERRTTTLCPLSDVPVLRLGSDVERIKFPIRRGDTVLLMFCSSSIAAWKAASGRLVDPQDDRHHHLADAVAITGLFAAPPPASGTPPPIIDLGDDAVRLGASEAAQSVLLGEVFLSALSALVTTIGTAVGSVPGGAAAGSTIATALATFNGQAATYSSQKVKVI